MMTRVRHGTSTAKQHNVLLTLELTFPHQIPFAHNFRSESGTVRHAQQNGLR